MKKKLVPKCPCCGEPTNGVLGNYEICSICGWEDDPIQSDDPKFSGGANDLSLAEYRETWLKSYSSQRKTHRKKNQEKKT
jgi:Cysteine-rich CPCC